MRSGSIAPKGPRPSAAFARSFCQGPGHGTGYQDQIIIEARDFLAAIHGRRPVWPEFADGLAVWQVVDAALRSAAARGGWIDISSLG